MTVQTHPDRFEAVLFEGPFVVVRAYDNDAGVSLFLRTAGLCDALIAAAVEAKRLLDPPVTACESYSLKGNGCVVTESHWLHQDGKGHKWLSPESDPGGPETDPPVITDSERTCDQANPESGHGCQRSGDHGVHRDAYGEEWRTDIGMERFISGAPFCPASQEGALCELPAGHGGDHRAPGSDEGDPDVTWPAES